MTRRISQLPIRIANTRIITETVFVPAHESEGFGLGSVGSAHSGFGDLKR